MSNIPAALPIDPLPLFSAWFDTAIETTTVPNRDAMTLATAAPDGRIAARIVLCKQVVPNPGYLIFYTNYESDKGLQIDTNPNVAGVFLWDELGRQARIEGIAMRSPPEESDRYFDSRDRESRIGAWTSEQSRPIGSHAELQEKHAKMRERFAEPNGRIPRPPHWGGYRIVLRTLELWEHAEARLHDRARWERPITISKGEIRAGEWHGTRLQP